MSDTHKRRSVFTRPVGPTCSQESHTPSSRSPIFQERKRLEKPSPLDKRSFPSPLLTYQTLSVPSVPHRLTEDSRPGRPSTFR